MLKNKVELLQTNDENLFGKEFSDHLTESVKSKKSSKEVFLELEDSKKPFRSDPSFQQQQRKSGGQKQIATGNRDNQAKQNWSWSRKDTSFQGGGRRVQGKNITNSTVSGHVSSNSKCRAGKGSSINKTLVFKRDVNKSSSHSSSWKDKSLLSKLAKVDFKPGYSVTGKGLQNTIHQDAFLTKNFKFYQNEQETNCFRGFRIKGDAKERGNKEDSTCSRGVFEQLIPCGEKYYRHVINLKMLNQFIPFLHFKMEGLFQLKQIIQEGDWMCKLNLKDASFSVPLNRNSRKFVGFQWKGTLYEFICLCFGLGPAPRVFTKLLKIPISPEKDQHQSENIFGRYVGFESHSTRSSHEPRQSYISCRIWAL